VLDWTAGQLAHPAFDLAFTHLLLANPPLAAPKALRPIINTAARRLANRFINTYRKIGPHPSDNDTLDWYRRLHACRIITDLTAWQPTAPSTPTKAIHGSRWSRSYDRSSRREHVRRQRDGGADYDVFATTSA